MVDCLYRALVDHLEYLGIEVQPETRATYDLFRLLSGHMPDEMTFAGIAPIISIFVAASYKLAWTVEQNPEFDLIKQASERERPYVLSSHSRITEGPGIYCGYFKQHCFFWPELPEGDIWVLSIKLRRL